MSKPTLVLIDFDHTLFDTDKFKKQIDVSKPLPNNLDEYIFADAFDFLEYASKFANLSIFSEGPQPFQTEKIKSTSILNRINSKYFFSYPPHQKIQAIPGLKKNYQLLAAVDDKPEHCDSIAKQGIACIRIKRGKFQEENCKQKPTFEVESLYEIVKNDLLSKV